MLRGKEMVKKFFIVLSFYSCKNYIVKITNLLVSTVARNSGSTGYCGYLHDVTMTLCVSSIKMYTRIN